LPSCAWSCFASLFANDFADVDAEGQGEAALSLGGAPLFILFVKLSEDHLDLFHRRGAEVEGDAMVLFCDRYGLLVQEHQKLLKRHFVGLGFSARAEEKGCRDDGSDIQKEYPPIHVTSMTSGHSPST
jgi:hypothetical protein